MGSEGQFSKQNLDNALGGVAIPEGRDAARLAFSYEDFLRGGREAVGRVRERQYGICVYAVRGAGMTVRARKAPVRCKAFDSGSKAA
jgi:hypothetical protein